MTCNCPSCSRAITYAEFEAGDGHICPHCDARMVLPDAGSPMPRLLPRPPKPPLFGIRIHPVVGVALLILLVAFGLLIAFASNPNFMPAFNPFPGAPDPRR